MVNARVHIPAVPPGVDGQMLVPQPDGNQVLPVWGGCDNPAAVWSDYQKDERAPQGQQGYRVEAWEHESVGRNPVRPTPGPTPSPPFNCSDDALAASCQVGGGSSSTSPPVPASGPADNLGIFLPRLTDGAGGWTAMQVWLANSSTLSLADTRIAGGRVSRLSRFTFVTSQEKQSSVAPMARLVMDQRRSNAHASPSAIEINNSPTASGFWHVQPSWILICVLLCVQFGGVLQTLLVGLLSPSIHWGSALNTLQHSTTLLGEFLNEGNLECLSRFDSCRQHALGHDTNFFVDAYVELVVVFPMRSCYRILLTMVAFSPQSVMWMHVLLLVGFYYAYLAWRFSPDRETKHTNSATWSWPRMHWPRWSYQRKVAPKKSPVRPKTIALRLPLLATEHVYMCKGCGVMADLDEPLDQHDPDCPYVGRTLTRSRRQGMRQ